MVSCRNKKDIPDVSGIPVQVSLQRFDLDFFSMDTMNLERSLGGMEQKYSSLTPLFLKNILGLDSQSAPAGIKKFLALNRSIEDSVNLVFKNTDFLKNEFRDAFRFLLYYFPGYPLPRIITVTGPIDALAQSGNGYTPDFLGPDFLGISLQFYLGKNFPVYKDRFFIDNVAPLYRSRRFSKEYIIADAMQIIVDDIFPDKSNGRALIEQMVEKGKQWYLLDKFLPTTPDSIKTGYTGEQLDWCRENEGLIWAYLVKNENLNSIDPTTIQTYIGEGPFTQGFSQELSPGNIGQWIGWQIVKKWVVDHPELKPGDVMKTDPRKIIEEAKYKPK